MIESVATVISIIKDVYKGIVFIWNKLRGKDSAGSVNKPEVKVPNEVFGLVQRFVDIYKAHGIERTQIPRFLGEDGGLTLVDVSTDEKLLYALNEKLLQATCDQFGVQREWLDGKDVPIYPYLWHGHDLPAYIDFLLELKKTGCAIQGFGIKRQEDKLRKSSGKYGEDYDPFFIALLFRVKLDHWGDHSQDSIWRYYPLCDQIYWGYEKTRMQLKAKILIADILGVYFKGCVMEEHEIEGIMEGRIFPGPLMEHRSHVGWHPEDYIYTEEESRAVADSEEALKVREWMLHNGWRKKLEEIVGPIEENTPFRAGEGNLKWRESRKQMNF
ncbi:hypothetical protein [Pelobacter seleniigenes]|uniref:hypothetical protein n=1 Tax=Pelobacter seleniigenes TaxID=407188 RepID=UPI0004A773E3|nr:hypothetical protein [Pelobacter seleniigenes]